MGKFSKFITWINSFTKNNLEYGKKIEIIFAEDGSTDNSYNILLSLKKKITCPIQIVHSSVRLGKGGGFFNGINSARGEIVVLYDCDMAVSPDQIPNLLDSFKPNVDIVIGSRKHKKTKILNYPTFSRYILGAISGLIVNLLFYIPVSETQCGFKAFRKKKILNIFRRMDVKGWFFDMELLLLSYYLGLSIVEIPVNYLYINPSKINQILDPIKIFFDILKMRLKSLAFYPVLKFNPNKEKK